MVSSLNDPLLGASVYINGEFVGYYVESTWSKNDPLGYGTVEYINEIRLEVKNLHVSQVTRPSFDEYFLGIADAVSMRGDCSRRQVGAVVVDKDNRIVSTGFNGSYPRGPSCLAGECPRASSGVEPLSSYDTGPGACVAAHAEQNALLYAGQSRTKGATIYITCEPCDGCLKLIKAAGIKRVIWPEGQIGKKDLYG